MSDYYDSLEDECDENKCSSGSPKERETPAADLVTTVSGNKSTERYSFYLSKSVSEERINILPNGQISKSLKSNGEKKSFLPEIGNGVNESGAESIQSLFVDQQTLSKQGLQLNNDGSFTKSPRLDTEELPFITRKYRDLQFQRKNTYKVDKKSSFKKIQKKNIFSFAKKPVDGISMDQIINARNEKGSSEEMLTSRGSSISAISHLKTDEQLLPKDNLTDSMKEKLLQSQRESPSKALKTTNNLKKTKHELNLMKNREISRRNKFSHIVKGDDRGDPAKNVLSKERCLKNSNSLNCHKKKHKSTDLKIFKYQSDIFTNTERPKLNYSELRLLKNGYNPMYLRHRSKKVQSDTDRSNFGDSVMEEFSEIPNLTANTENLAHDESEDSFYLKLIERDKNQKQLIQLSTRSENPVQDKKLKEENGSNSYKGPTEMRKNGKDRRKQTSKSLSIDLPPEVDCSVNTSQKFSHYCSADPFRNVSKVELALKAKTYGYLANARNIFRLKTQSERKFVETEKEENPTINRKMASLSNRIVNLSQGSDKPIIHDSSPFPNVEEESIKTLKKFPSGTKSFYRTEHLRTGGESKEGLVLPPVDSTEVRNNHKKILKRKTLI